MELFQSLRKGEVTLDELIQFEDLKYDFNKNLLALARLKACGKGDSSLEEKVNSQRALLKEASDLKKSLGVADLSPGEEELRRLAAEFKQTRDGSILEKIDAVVFKIHSKKKAIAEKTIEFSKKKKESGALPSLPQIDGLVVRVIHGRRSDYVLEDDAARFDTNECEIKKANEELQGWRLKSDAKKCRELEKLLSSLIEKRESFISMADKLISKAEAAPQPSAAEAACGREMEEQKAKLA